MAVPAKRLFIYGSCVSRDMAEFGRDSGIEVEAYVARQSLISAGSKVNPALLGSFPDGSSFASRMVRGDAKGDLFERMELKADGADRIVWDLVDERLGVYAFPDGSYSTRSYELLGAEGLEFVPAEARLIPFGEDEHFDLWCAALERFEQFLVSKGWLDKTRLLYVPWAPFDLAGNFTRASFGVRALEANVLYSRYFEHIREHSKIGMIEPEEELVLADPEHKWGPAPFHYQQELYGWIVDQL
ncbi:hypothetical protein BSR28_01995 [Boudabousia liubingyangii]|uniref:DUF6270 domain-containing protein n=1 Tax=Boudabousia liubingyangii TaxID=1921764 RepID=UPI00093D4354|nr:DUF6270 domain-containing protein [Boudabousia liubingyangii]OKL48599.1 hypothetical protein BSR28_01995 [Boudabousia liubingyangii]